MKYKSGDSASPSQLATLRAMGIHAHEWLPREEADALIKAHRAKWEALPPTPGQRKLVEKWGLWKQGMTRGEADVLIGRRTGRLPPVRSIDPHEYFLVTGEKPPQTEPKSSSSGNDQS